MGTFSIERAVLNENLAITSYVWKGWAETSNCSKIVLSMASELKPLWFAAAAAMITAATGLTKVELLLIIVRYFLDHGT